MYFLSCYTARFHTYFPANGLEISVCVNAAAWILQFIGHGVFEKRSPAFFDNVIQAFSVAPLFVYLEGLFWIGYRPTLKKKIDMLIEEALRKEATLQKRMAKERSD